MTPHALRSAVLATLMFAPPLSAQALRVPVTIDTLPNGLVVIVHEDHTLPIVAVDLWYHVGSGDERPGRTGFAHLYEHLMFMGSEHAPYPAFDRLLEAAGADNNASTGEDRTNYYESGPSNALPLMLWLEADRMGWFLPTMTAEKVDLQRDVVKNERRESYENQPYGLAEETILGMLYPAGHPYSWPVIGSMQDLSAASVEDVKAFFRRFYTPNNASLVVVGDVRSPEVQRLARNYFAGIPSGPPAKRSTVPEPVLPRDTSGVLEDQVQLPRLYYVWHSVKAFAPDDPALGMLADILAGARSSRLTQALVYGSEVAADVDATQDGKRLGGDFWITATAKPGHALPELQKVIETELERIASTGPSERELEQAKNSFEARMLRGLERVNATADALNSFYVRTGNPDGFQAQLDRYRAVTAGDIERVARTYLRAPRVTLSVVPKGRRDLAAGPVEVMP
jgi:zinc protease